MRRFSSRLDCCNSHHRTPELHLPGPVRQQTPGWWWVSPSCGPSFSLDVLVLLLLVDLLVLHAGPGLSSQDLVWDALGVSVHALLDLASLCGANRECLEHLGNICFTSGIVIRPLHMLLKPPWNATLNIVFLANLEILVPISSQFTATSFIY